MGEVIGHGLFAAIFKLEDECPSNYRANKNKEWLTVLRALMIFGMAKTLSKWETYFPKKTFSYAFCHSGYHAMISLISKNAKKLHHCDIYKRKFVCVAKFNV